MCSKTEVAVVAEGLRIGQALAAGTTLARECANRPGNHCTPSHLAQQARKLAKSHGLKVEVKRIAATDIDGKLLWLEDGIVKSTD